MIIGPPGSEVAEGETGYPTLADKGFLKIVVAATLMAMASVLGFNSVDWTPAPDPLGEANWQATENLNRENGVVPEHMMGMTFNDQPYRACRSFQKSDWSHFKAPIPVVINGLPLKEAACKVDGHNYISLVAAS